jgi:CheY-like chemotaxis protein
MATSSSANVTPEDLTILVVDDDPDLLLLCATHLRTAGYAVLMALGSTEAQATCDIYPMKIDLILIDVLLYPRTVDVDHDRNVTPRVHGDKLATILRTKRPLTRILLMSASTPWTLGGRGMSEVLRVYPFLPKPFTKQSLIDKVAEVLASPLPARAKSGLRLSPSRERGFWGGYVSGGA